MSLPRVDAPPAGGIVETDIPARLDRLPWGIAAERRPLEEIARPLSQRD